MRYSGYKIILDPFWQQVAQHKRKDSKPHPFVPQQVDKPTHLNVIYTCRMESAEMAAEDVEVCETGAGD